MESPFFDDDSDTDTETFTSKRDISELKTNQDSRDIGKGRAYTTRVQEENKSEKSSKEDEGKDGPVCIENQQKCNLGPREERTCREDGKMSKSCENVRDWHTHGYGDGVDEEGEGERELDRSLEVSIQAMLHPEGSGLMSDTENDGKEMW